MSRDPWHHLKPGDPFDMHDMGHVFSGTVVAIWSSVSLRKVAGCRVLDPQGGRTAEINLLRTAPSTEWERTLGL